MGDGADESTSKIATATASRRSPSPARSRKTWRCGCAQTYEDRTPRIPASPDIRDSIHSVYKIVDGRGQSSIRRRLDRLTGHADFFWAQALSLMATGDGVKLVPTVYSEGERTWGTREGGLG
jgi:phage FluMu gp28-like protein